MDDAVAPESSAPASPKRHRRILVGAIVVVLLLVLIGVCSRLRSGSKAAAGGRGAAGPVPVAVAAAQQKDVPVYLRGLGNVLAYYTVNVRTRIDGQLQRVNFQEGQTVRAGSELALIDPRPSETALMQAQAKLFQDTATLENNRRDLVRLNDLYHAGVIPQQQYDAQKATATSAEGLVRADEAAVATAKLNVAYCHIDAPITGKVGLRNVDPGNMVHAADPNPMMTITQVEPIAVIFTLPEDNLEQVTTHVHPGDPLTVEAWSRDDTQQLSTGHLETIDNQIDPNTGTFKLKSVFDNHDGALFPNQFVNARLKVDTMHAAVVIPAPAVQHGAQGTYVYVVKPDKSVESRPVTVSLSQGTESVIGSGLQAGELVVTDGQDKLQPGAKVQIAGGRSANGASGRGPRKKP